MISDRYVVSTEPVLPMADIQGIAVPGFFKPYQTLLGVVCDNNFEAIRLFKSFIRSAAIDIATAAQTLEDRRRFRARRVSVSDVALTAITFSYQGLRKLTPSAQEFPSSAFRDGLAARSLFLGDPNDP